MFEYISGILNDKFCTANGYYLIVDVNGLGYKLEVSELDFNAGMELNSEIKVYTKLIHKEDLMCLCGFLKKET